MSSVRATFERAVAVALLAALVAACGNPVVSPSPGQSGISPAPAASSPAASPAATGPAPSAGSPSAAPSASAAPTPRAAKVSLAVVTGFSAYTVRPPSKATLGAAFTAGKVLVPCGAAAAIAAALRVAAPASGEAGCVPADRIPARLDPATATLALLPAALVTPRVRVLPLDGADLFGEAPARGKAYPLVIPTPTGWPAAWTAWNKANVRVIVTTGVNCPDRGVSRQTNVLGKGWNWLLAAGTAKYTGRYFDTRYGWWVMKAVRTGNAGAVADLIREADLAESDFECAMTKGFVQHDSGTSFTIDPKVAPLMAKAGFDVAAIAADHTTNAGLGPVGETVDLFRNNGIAPVGAGRTLAEALRPAVIDVRGIKFGFVAFDAIGGSTYATAGHGGVAPLTLANAKAAIKAARAAGADVVFALPQWSSVEYRAAFTPFQKGLITLLETAGADHIIGADFHWAGAISITPGGASGYRFVTSSQGNFWFGQDWSRQTQEGIITTLTFVGTRLAQVRLVPTTVLDNAQPNLTDPATDGQFVLRQVLGPSTLLPR